MEEARGPGRPPHQPTEESREQVAVLAGGGMRHEDIALALGITKPTLEKHYPEELSIAASAKRAAVLEALYRAALKGNTSAAKAYLANEPGIAAPPLEGESPLEDPSKALPEGKKEQAAAAAKTAAAGTEWEELLGAPNVVPIRP